MAPSVVHFNPARIRQWFNRVPLFTRVVSLIIVLFWLASLLLVWIPSWGALTPDKVGIWSMYRLNTFPVVHIGFLHAIVNLIALIPLLERFETEHGTLVSITLFTGPFSTVPGAIYILVNHIILRGNTSIQGASTWVFLLLSCEGVKLSKSNPTFHIAHYKIPIWITPLVVIFFTHFLVPNTSFIGNLCGALIGYGFELGYLKFLIPPERVLRWIEGKLNLLGRLPHYVSVDQNIFGRYGVLPSSRDPAVDGTTRNFMVGSTQRLGP